GNIWKGLVLFTNNHGCKYIAPSISTCRRERETLRSLPASSLSTLTRLSMSIKPAHVALIPVFAIASMLAACKEQAPAQGAGAAPAPLVGMVTLEAKPYALTTELPGRTAA